MQLNNHRSSTRKKQRKQHQSRHQRLYLTHLFTFYKARADMPKTTPASAQGFSMYRQPEGRRNKQRRAAHDTANVLCVFHVAKRCWFLCYETVICCEREACTADKRIFDEAEPCAHHAVKLLLIEICILARSHCKRGSQRIQN